MLSIPFAIIATLWGFFLESHHWKCFILWSVEFFISIARKQIIQVLTSTKIFHRWFLEDLISFTAFFLKNLSLNEFSFWLHMLHWEILQNACSDRIFFNMSYYMLLWVSTEKTYFNSHFQALSWEGELPSSFKVTGFDGWRTLTKIPVSF